MSTNPGPGGHKGIQYGVISNRIKNILAVSQIEIDTVMKKLRSLGLITMKYTTKKGRLWDAYVQVENLVNLERVTKGFLAGENQKDPAGAVELAFMDIFDFAKLVKSHPEIIIKKIGAGEIPPSLLFLRSEEAREFAKKEGLESFKKLRKLTSRVEDMAGIDDIVEVDNETLQDVFGRLGHYKMVYIYAMAEGPTREKILTNVSANTGKMLAEEAAGRTIDANEAQDIEYELIASIKKAKGVRV
jgi:hypothetical protein